MGSPFLSSQLLPLETPEGCSEGRPLPRESSALLGPAPLIGGETEAETKQDEATAQDPRRGPQGPAEETSAVTHVVEVLGGFHDVRGPLVLLQLHPALPEELPAGSGGHPGRHR